jgi:2,3-bisphosphoglycerate-dependent phosphoglycerate mutase
MEKHIYFVRHGESDSNVDGVVRGDAAMLSEKGKEQAAVVAKRIKKIGVDAIVSSPYPRTMDTAKAISQEVDLLIEENDLFVERRRPSELLGRSYLHDEESKNIMYEIFDGYASENHRHSDEEAFTDLRTRANAALNFLAAHPAERICVVTHGLFLRMLFCAALNGPNFSGIDLQNAMRTAETDNTGVSHLYLHEDHFSSVPTKHWVIKNWNDSAHLG